MIEALVYLLLAIACFAGGAYCILLQRRIYKRIRSTAYTVVIRPPWADDA